MSKSRIINFIVAAKDQVTGVLGKIQSGITRFGALALKGFAVAGAGVTALGAGLAALGSKMAGLIDEQAKVASSLGIANEKLGVYRNAAEYAGVSAGDLTTALRNMSKGIFDATQGTGQAQAALESLGLSAEELERQGPAKAFEIIIEQLDKLPPGIQKSNLAMQLFGRTGVQMTNITAEGLRTVQREADQMGLKLTSAQAGQVEAARDAWSKIKNVVTDFMQNVTARLAPGIRSGFEKAFDFIKRQDLQQWAANAALAIAKAFQGTLVVFGAVGEAVIAITRTMATAFNISNQMLGGLSAMAVTDATKRLEQIRAEIERVEGGAVRRFNQ